MNRIPEDILTLGLIIKTRPFQYMDNQVTCHFEDYIEVDVLETLKSSLEDQLKNLNEADKTDEAVRSFHDDIYFLDYLIQLLKSA